MDERWRELVLPPRGSGRLPSATWQRSAARRPLSDGRGAATLDRGRHGQGFVQRVALIHRYGIDFFFFFAAAPAAAAAAAAALDLNVDPNETDEVK